MSTTSRILKATEIAEYWHRNQRYGELSYGVHLRKVLQKWEVHKIVPPGYTAEDMQLAMLFHDTREDTDLDSELLEILTNKKTRYLVESVTDSQGPTREACKWGSPRDPGPYLKLQGNPGGLVVKLCDRWANAEASYQNMISRGKDKFFLRYKEEQDTFWKALYVPGTICEPLWVELNKVLQYEPTGNPFTYQELLENWYKVCLQYESPNHNF